MRQIRSREEIIQERIKAFRWIDANRNNNIPFNELEKLFKDTLKSKVDIYTLRKLNYLKFDSSNDYVTVLKRFDDYNKVYSEMKQYAKQKRAEYKQKRNVQQVIPLDNSEILNLLHKIINHLGIK